MPFDFYLPQSAQILDSLPAYLGLVMVMFGTLYLGQMWGANRNSTGRNTVKEWIGIVDGPILALYGLLLAFTFHGAMQRFDERRRFAVEEATLISTAFHQMDRLTPEDRKKLTSALREYMESRILLDQINRENQADPKSNQSHVLRSRSLLKKCWQEALPAVDRPGAKPDAPNLLATLDQLMNLLIKRATIPQFHPPWQVMALFIFLAMVSSFLVGFQISSLRRKSWPHVLLFVFVLALVTYLIIDLEYPFVGYIRMSDGQEILRQLMETIQP